MVTGHSPITRRHVGWTVHACRLRALVVVALLWQPSHGVWSAPREQDAVWLMSTRGLSSVACCHPMAHPLKVWQLEDGCHWQRSSTEDFYAADDTEVITTVYVHGNRMDSREAISQGMAVYRFLSARADSDIRLRHVIWSWPSDKVFGPLRDARIKAERTRSEAYYLGHVVAGMSPDIRVSLIGYSFGARVTTGSTHLLGGGSIGGHVLAESRPTPVRVVLIAAALNNDWLIPGHMHGNSGPLVDRMLITYNPCDRLLKRYPLISKSERPTALGYSGLICSHLLGETTARIEQINTARWIGKSHDFASHWRSAGIREKVGQLSLWN